MHDYLATQESDEAVLDIPQLHQSDGEDRACLIAILDGSDQFAREHDSQRAASKEWVHSESCVAVVESLDGQVSPCGGARFRDAVMACFLGERAMHRALAAGVAIHQRLNLWNIEHQLNWIEQVHTRIGVSMGTFSETHLVARQALRGEVVVRADDWNRITDDEALLLSPGLGVRIGAEDEVWQEILKETEQGIEPLDGERDRIQRLLTFLEREKAEVRSEQGCATEQSACG